jgi:ergothioneine biosynthesis protein EgtB
MMCSTAADPSVASHESLLEQFRRVRRFTEKVCEPLVTEDYVIQSMPDVSPTRWHLAHTTWFFETFVLKPFVPGYESKYDAFTYLFNSYYNTVGKQFPRAQRGLLSRPSVAEIWSYRHSVEQILAEWAATNELPEEVQAVIELGIHHEQQHQELMLTDIKHVLSRNPLFPVYRTSEGSNSTASTAAKWLEFQEDLVRVGHEGVGFCFDNESPRHRASVHDFRLRDRLSTNAEYLEFVNDHGYERPEFWLSLGWATVQANRWQAPLYWVRSGDQWTEFSLAGLHALDLDQPVCHVSYFEADAFARWSGRRLPTEFEWEHAVADAPVEGHLADADDLHFQPRVAPAGDGLRQCFGDVWEWTSSPYGPYPGYQSLPGAIGEYNGKFMCNQFVLRGGSCATPKSHIRPTYRNFFPPEARWQFSGIRLAE